MRAVAKEMIQGQVRAALRPSHVDRVEVREVLMAALSLGHDPVELYFYALISRPPEYEPAPTLDKVLPPSVIKYLAEQADQEDAELEEEIDSELPGETELEELNREPGEKNFLAPAVSHGDEQPRAEVAPTAARPAQREPRALTALLIDQLVARRGGQSTKAAERGLPVGSGHAHVVDLEGDAPALTRSLADAADPVADALERATQDIAAALSVPGRFGGFTASPQLQGLRLEDSIYLNPLYAWHRATEELARDPLEGLTPRDAFLSRLGLRGGRDERAAAFPRSSAVRDAQIYKTAQNAVDVLIHEIAHHEARHDFATGHADFIPAYSQALRALVPTYVDLIRLVQHAIEQVADRMEPLVLVYRNEIDRRARRMTDRRKELEMLIQKALADQKRASDIRVRLEPELPSDDPLPFVLASRGKAVILELRKYRDPENGQRHNGVFDPQGAPSDPPLIKSESTFGKL